MFSFRSLPIKTRLAFSFAGVSTVLLLVHSAVIYSFSERVLRRDAMQLVQSQYETILSDLEFVNGSSNGLELAEKTLSRVDDATNLGLLVFVYDASWEPILSPTPLDMPLDKAGPFELENASDHFFVYGGKFENSWLYVVLNERESVDGKLSILFDILLSVGFFSILTIFFISYSFSKKALRPLDLLKNSINTGSLGNEIFAKDEIGFLAEEFRQYKNRADESLMRERQFSADVSHELRTPLTVIRTSLELLESKPMDGFSINKIRDALSCVDEMDRLISRLLILEHWVSNRNAERIDLTKFFEKFLEPFRVLANKKDLRLQMHQDQTPISILAFPGCLEHVFWNLIWNAIRYTEQGGVKIALHADRVEIKDSWQGIEEGEVEKIWNRFYRSEKSRTSEGFGLGLSIAKKFADEAGWRIEVDSKRGIWTTFTVYFNKFATFQDVGS